MPEEREQWKSKLGFILAAAGSAVGLGNIWRFPFVAGEEGGAAFLIIYLVAIVLIGYPLMVSEISLGRFTQRNPAGAFKAIAPKSSWWLVGILSVLTGFTILSYYSVIAGWSLSYIFKALSGFPEGVEAADAMFGEHITGLMEPIFYHLIFMLLCVGVISAGVVKGIQRVVTYLMPILAILIIIVAARSLTLDGAAEGLSFLFAPDFSVVTADTFLAAIGQAFFTLSLGMGAILTYGSYLSKNDDVSGSSVQIIGADLLIAILSGIAIFPAVFAFGFDPADGPGLVFVTLPAVFAEMPAGIIFGTLFFILLSIAALTSAMSLLEVVVAYFVDEKSWQRKKATFIIGAAAFIVGLFPVLGYSALDHVTFAGMDLLDTFDFIADSVMLPLAGALISIFAGHIWGAQNVRDEANRSSSIQLGTWISPLLKYVIPIAVLIAMITGVIETLG